MPAKTLHFQSPRHLSQLYAGKTENLAHAERALGVKLVTREDWLKIEAAQEPLALAEEFFAFLNAARSQGMNIRTPDFARLVDSFAKGEAERWQAFLDEPLVIATNRKSVVPKTIGQKEYLQSVLKQPIVFGIGPAGTGKTYLAMAAAVSALLNHEVERIVLTRPAVEAGEALGFLPGDLREKILPYLRPLYDALHDMLDPEEVVKLTEKGIIEIAPLAYMRGRTLSSAFIVLDEAQNTTPEQMMMFLTRLGEDSRMVVTGDVTQIDLPRAKVSGLVEVRQDPRARARDRVPHLWQPGRRAPPARPADHRGVRPLQEPARRRARRRPLTMSVRNQLRLLVGGLSAHRGDAKSAPGSGFRDFLEQSRLVAGLIFVVTVAAIVIVSSAGMRVLYLPVLPNQIAPVRIVAGFPFTYVSAQRTRAEREQSLSSLPPIYRVDTAPLERFETAARSLLGKIGRVRGRPPRPLRPAL